MIDPRALQQHFKKVQQKQEPIRSSVPRIPDPKPLTAIEAISVLEPVIEQEEVSGPVPEIKEPKEEINLVINVPPPIGDIVIEETEIKEAKASKPPDINDYDPYGYYSGPKF